MNFSRIIILFFLVPMTNVSQEKYPQNYFTQPLKNELILSGNFGELRSNHFHSGIDIKTQKKQGLNVHSSAEGFISRIKISHGGFGKALYIDHPNGFTTVYGHLKNFNKKIESFIKKIQYQKKSYEIDMYLNKNNLLVEKNEIVAFSGNTGSSTGPHLHFEIRSSKNQKPLNPLLFGFSVDDMRRPEIKSIYLYNNIDFNNYRSINPNKLNLKKVNDSIYITNEALVENKFGFGVNIFDRQDLANNKNGVYKILSFVDNNLVSSIKFDGFSFEESILINTLIDYKHYSETKEKIIKLFKTKGNKLSIYDKYIYEFIDSNLVKSEFRIKLERSQKQQHIYYNSYKKIE
ncbi:MAG: M23 family metallopeptidase [Flavobacteriaceae bacterium]